MNMQQLTKTQKITVSAAAMAIYIVLMSLTQSFAFGQYQVRIATAIYSLAYLFPFLVGSYGPGANLRLAEEIQLIPIATMESPERVGKRWHGAA
jgi:hypothetical protein